jgi:hypothetical protein
MALVTAVSRGLDVELFVSEIGDQFMVFHAQRSYYEQLLRAGVKIYLYRVPTILRAKHLSIDDDVCRDRLVESRYSLTQPAWSYPSSSTEPCSQPPCEPLKTTTDPTAERWCWKSGYAAYDESGSSSKSDAADILPAVTSRSTSAVRSRSGRSLHSHQAQLI